MSSALPLKVVVMAGGSGTRFWPLSRQHRPKQLLPLFGGQSLLQATAARLVPLCGWPGLLVVTGQHLASAVAQQLPELPPDQLLAEPEGRDTAACVGWVAWRLLARGENPVMAVLPADHWVGDDELFRRVLRAAVEVATEKHCLVTIGLAPNRPETGYGYLQLAECAGQRQGVRFFPVHRFVEKPSLERACEFLQAGNYRWNAGIFVFEAAVVAAAIRQHLPELAQGLDRLLADAQELGEEQALARHYPSLPRISLDYGVMEKAENIWAVEGQFPWHDVGSFASFAQLLPESELGVSLGPSVTLDARGCVLVSQGPLIAAVGVEGLVVVATEDAVLVTTRSQTQRIKELVALLPARGLGHLL